VVVLSATHEQLPDTGAAMDHAADLQALIAQERRLVLPRFDLDVAWRIGLHLGEIAVERGHALTIELRVARETVFFRAMQGVAPVNADWARRKRNTVELMQRSSLRVGLEPSRSGLPWHEALGLPLRDYAGHGGSFPLQVAGAGCIGAVTVSGAPDREDHAMVVQALEALCGAASGAGVAG
jgi:uncharacterized protein (UPF0303 family)